VAWAAQPTRSVDAVTTILQRSARRSLLVQTRAGAVMKGGRIEALRVPCN
jgi:hypothetical protein